MIPSLRKKIKYLLPAVIVLMVLGLILSRIYQPEPRIPEPEITIKAEETQHYIGRVAKVCGIVANARFIPQIGGQPTFINFGQPEPDQNFTIVIRGEDRMKWDQPPENIYPHKELCVTGVIESHEGTPQIVVAQPKQIQIMAN